jgi:guanosine-3',5'-bis(diphosphate) 3'-pyrophosphohydrolase
MCDLSHLINTIIFATNKHQGQVRKGANHLPYITHPLAVANTIVEIGKITDSTILTAAILHDTIEDTKTEPEDLSQLFGDEVLSIVQEVTDNKSLLREERKRLQIIHAPHLSYAARMIKWGDKYDNCQDILNNPPEDWSLQRLQNYVQWAADVLAQIHDTNAPIEAAFDKLVDEAERTLDFKVKGFDSINERPWAPGKKNP